MITNQELSWKQLKTSYQPSDFPFTTTEEVKSSGGMIGQEHALKAISLGLKIKGKGHNIYICGSSSLEAEEAIKKVLKEQAQQRCTPPDLCYVYNFKNPECPELIELKPTEGKNFKEDMEEFKAFILEELPLKLVSNEVKKKKETILEELESIKEKFFMELEEKAGEEGILVKSSEEGIGFIPLDKKENPISQEEYSALTSSQKDILTQKLQCLTNLLGSIYERIEAEEKKYGQILSDIDEEVVLIEVGGLIKYLNKKYEAYPKIQTYCNAIAEDILEHLEMFTSDKDKKKQELKELLPWVESNPLTKLVQRYTVNLLITHEEDEGAPIITDDTLLGIDLSGKILLDSEINVLRSDFTEIRPGLFHKANGGYLILHMQRILENARAWSVLKTMLKTNLIYIEGNEDLNIALARPIHPKAMKADIKVILLGSEAIYKVLCQHDEDFKRLFKIRIRFDNEIDNTVDHIQRLATRIKRLSEEEGIPPVTTSGLIRLVEYGNKKVESSEKLPGYMDELLDLLREAQIYAGNQIDEKCIQKAIEQRDFVYTRWKEKVDDHIKDEIYLIDTEGEKVGQVNGLAVCTIEDFSFGKPVRITATTYRGKQGIIDIEKQSDLSGSIHTKGIHIITGFLGSQFAQDMPLSLSCNICFEQSYGPVDGDSASSAELYAILSSLSGVPIKQNLATTGSVNQFGEIQPIGGVNEKVEGFFNVCTKKGLKGTEGVIIPKQNAKELMLSDLVIEAVKENKFHIYTISNIWEGMELMTGKSKEEIRKGVKEKLIRFNE